MSNATTNSGRLAILQPIMQYGFAGMCAVLLGMIVWMQHRADGRFDKLLEIQRESHSVIERNTAAIEALAR